MKNNEYIIIIININKIIMKHNIIYVLSFNPFYWFNVLLLLLIIYFMKVITVVINHCYYFNIFSLLK